MSGEKLNRSSNRGVAKVFGQIACLWRRSVASLSPRHLSVLLVVCLVAILATACDSIDEFVEERTSESTPVLSATRTAIPEGTTAAGPHNFTEVPTPRAGPTASGLVLPVSIAAVPVDLPEYDRGTWRHWIDEDSDCQNARQEVLIAESSVEVTYESGDECRVATGSWLGPYTGKTVSSPSELDIDHLVPLGNAHRSGAWSWDRERKREFANHLGYDDHLIATTSSANRSKGSKGPENWRPELESYWCSYATAWVAVKNAWGLTVTEAEYTALAEMLSTCEMPVILEPGSGAPPPMPTATMAPTPPAGLRYDPFGPDRNCGDFDTYQEALTFFLAAGGPDVDRHRLDVNGDGEPCETLPGGPSAEESPDPSSSMSALYATFPTPSLEEETNCPPATSSGTLGGQGAAEQTSTASDSDCPLPPTPISEPQATSTPAPHPTVSLHPGANANAHPKPDSDSRTHSRNSAGRPRLWGFFRLERCTGLFPCRGWARRRPPRIGQRRKWRSLPVASRLSPEREGAAHTFTKPLPNWGTRSPANGGTARASRLALRPQRARQGLRRFPVMVEGSEFLPGGRRPRPGSP